MGEFKPIIPSIDALLEWKRFLRHFDEDPFFMDKKKEEKPVQHLDNTSKETISSSSQEEIKETENTASSSPYTGAVNGHEWVQLWEGGPKFATCNIGASMPWEYGGYYTWGGTRAQGKGKYKDDHWEGGRTLPSDRDTATVFWGKKWRMPTYEEFYVLLENCGKGEWIENYKHSGVNGRLFRGKGICANQELFLPAAGYFSNDSFYNSSSFGNYWSNTRSVNYKAWYLYTSNRDTCLYEFTRVNAQSVRAILNE